MATVKMGSNFPAQVSAEIFNKVKGHSSLAKLSRQSPIPFTGSTTFTFSMDGDISIVAEGGEKPDGGFTVAPVTVQPIKVMYQGRVSNEFLYAADEVRLNMMQAWINGAAIKFGQGLDKMAMHGVNPATNTNSPLITSHLDKAQKITLTNNPEADLEDAIAALGDNDYNGVALSKTFGASLGKLKENGVSQYPEFRLGGQPEALAGVACDVNSTIAPVGAYVGDFQNAFKYGYGKDIQFEVIEYGDPDGKGDLKRTNEVCLRAEAFIGFGVLDLSSFARIAGE